MSFSKLYFNSAEGVLSFPQGGKGEVNIYGQGNIIDVSKDCTWKGDIEIKGNDNLIEVASGVKFNGKIIVRGNGQKVSIGIKTTFQSVYILCQEGCSIQVGAHCMFSRNVEIRTTDAHSIIDLSSNKRLNKPSSVSIGHHVWVGANAFISKGSFIPNDSVVGANSFVNSVFKNENVLIAGSPALIKRENITWSRSRKKKFSDEEINSWKNDT